MGRRRPRGGHWCWCCGRVLANERFSGKGHSRHICKECSKLDGSEKEYRQAVADLDRACRHAYPFIHRSRRKWFDSLATSKNAKIQKLHAEVSARMTAEREELRRLREEGDLALEEEIAWVEEIPQDEDATPYDEPADLDDDEIPF